MRKTKVEKLTAVKAKMNAKLDKKIASAKQVELKRAEKAAAKAAAKEAKAAEKKVKKAKKSKAVEKTTISSF